MGECVFAEFAGMQAARRPSSQRRHRAQNSQSSSENALSCQKGLKKTITLTRFSDLLFMICVPSIHQLAVDKIAFGWLPESSHSLFLVIQGLCLLAFASSAIAVSRSAYSLSWLTFTFGHLLADMPLLLLRHNMCNFPPPLPF